MIIINNILTYTREFNSVIVLFYHVNYRCNIIKCTTELHRVNTSTFTGNGYILHETLLLEKKEV